MFTYQQRSALLSTTSLMSSLKKSVFIDERDLLCKEINAGDPSVPVRRFNLVRALIGTRAIGVLWSGTAVP